MLEDLKWSKASDWRFHEASHLRSTCPAPKPSSNREIKIAFYAKIAPGGFVVPHIDASPWYERWHYPLLTGGSFWEDGRYFQPTEPFMVRHWLPHAVFNDSDTPRIHMIVDYMPEIHPRSPTELVLTEMIPEVQALMDAIP